MLLVTGATGFIGRAVVARFLAADREVAVRARARDGLDARARVAQVSTAFVCGDLLESLGDR